jgi:phosphatidylserine/phosphatidylglycerophosphate/cardiolipin synthase-like enzyme
MGTSTGDWYEVYFTSPEIPFNNVFTGGIEEHLIDKIDAAQNSIDLAVYEFNLEDVTQALISAKQRGVEVRVVYDNEFSDPDPQMTELKNAGIQAVPDQRSAFMHNKFFVFDEKCIWTGSFNISVNAAYRNNENALYFCSQEAAANYTVEFSEMFSGEFGPSSPSNSPYPVFAVDGANIQNYFAPEDSVMDKVIAAVNKAQLYVHFMAFSFTDDALADAMLQKMSQGVTLGGIFESSGANTQYSECKTLLVSEADIWLDGNPRTFHHKVIIIDGKTVILGSFNFTANANESNDENLLIIQDSSLAAAYEQQFQLMKSQAVKPVGNTCQK